MKVYKFKADSFADKNDLINLSTIKFSYFDYLL